MHSPDTQDEWGEDMLRSLPHMMHTLLHSMPDMLHLRRRQQEEVEEEAARQVVVDYQEVEQNIHRNQ